MLYRMRNKKQKQKQGNKNNKIDRSKKLIAICVKLG